MEQEMDDFVITIDDCPMSLLSYAIQTFNECLLKSNLNPLDGFSEEFALSLIHSGTSECCCIQEYKTWIAVAVKKIGFYLLNKNEILEKCVQHELTPIQVLGLYEAERISNLTVFSQIQTHHESLIRHGWNIIKDKESSGSIESYASAAHEMGKKPWVRSINNWIVDYILGYYRGAGKSSRHIPFII
jgi:hypothetical protein